jgi:hypothetical protein
MSRWYAKTGHAASTCARVPPSADRSATTRFSGGESRSAASNAPGNQESTATRWARLMRRQPQALRSKGVEQRVFFFRWSRGW